MRYEDRILQGLLDTYENSLLSRGENKVAVHIGFPFTKKTLPVYFDESSMAYEEIHEAVKHLEEMGFVRIVWKKGKEDHIVQKVLLEEEKIPEVYAFMGRTPKSEMLMQQMQALRELEHTYTTPVTSAFISWLGERIERGKSVKEFLDLKDPEETRRLVSMIAAIEENQEEVYIREFSGRCFGDTKLLENRLGMIGKIFRKFSSGCGKMEPHDILAEYGVYHTPNYVYVKGMGKLCIGGEESGVLNLEKLRQGIGVSGEDLDDLEWRDFSQVRKVITIENLTTFFRWKEEDSVMIYLGGYHNTVRRKLLRNIYEKLPAAEYLHFGDIDVGGFEIYLDLCKKTGIPFRPYLMGVEQLQQYERYTKELTENDRRRLDVLCKKSENENDEIRPVLEYMKAWGVKLEQECILCTDAAIK